MEETGSKKYILYTIIGIAVVAVILGILYYFFLRTDSINGGPEQTIIGRIFGFPEPQQKKEEEVTLPLPVPEPTAIGTTTLVVEPKLAQLTDFAVTSASLNKKQDRVILYKKEGGNMFSYDFSGKIKDKISNITIVGIFNIAWNAGEDRRIVSYLDQDTVKSFLHIATSVVTLLPQQLRSPAWSPDGKMFSYLTENSGRTTIVTLDSAGKNPKNIFTTPLRDGRIVWITADRMIYETAPSGVAEGFVFLFSRSKGSFDAIIKGFGLTTNWSPDGGLALVSKTNSKGKGLALSIYDAAGNELFNPNIITLSEKCIWISAKKTYCAVPRNLQSGLIMPDDYLRGEIETADKIVMIDLEKNEVREVFNEQNFDISNLIVTKDERYALFIDRNDGTLWGVRLK